MVTSTPVGTVAQNVKAAIRDAGQTPSSIAKATGIPLTTLQRRLKGIESQSFTVNELALIADHLHLTPAELAYGRAA